jgi:hypothetical protein
MNDFVMYVNCAHGKGIKFIRDKLKFFAKTNIQTKGGDIFKSIVLYNADKLTIDAQSALRRCIELFCHNTRFFIIVEHKDKLLRPILSRFCEIYIPLPTIDEKECNLYKYNVEQGKIETRETLSHKQWLQRELKKGHIKKMNSKQLVRFTEKIYEKAYCALDIIDILENDDELILDEEYRYELLMLFHKVKHEFRNEQLLILFVLNYVFFETSVCLESFSLLNC